MDNWQMLHIALAFFSLAMAFVSFFTKRSSWIWNSFLIIALVMGYFGSILSPVCLLPIVSLFILHAILVTNLLSPFAHRIFFLLTIALSLGVMLGAFPGFEPFVVASNIQISKAAKPITLTLGFQGPIVAFFILGLRAQILKIITPLSQVGAMMKRAFFPIVIALTILISVAIGWKLVFWDPKLPKVFGIFLFQNLLFVCIVQEAFFRGFVQKELGYLIRRSSFWKEVGPILITSLFATIVYAFSTSSFAILAFVLLANILYGAIFSLTQSLQASICCHFLFNLIHFTLLTYPMLTSQLGISGT